MKDLKNIFYIGRLGLGSGLSILMSFILNGQSNIQPSTVTVG